MTVQPDLINHPPHYMGADGLEAIHVIEDWGLGFALGNAVKYVLRHRAKGGVEDLKKARWYVARAADKPPAPVVDHSVFDSDWVAHAFGLNTKLSAVLGAIWAATGTQKDIAAAPLLQRAVQLLDREIARLEAGA